MTTERRDAPGLPSGLPPGLPPPLPAPHPAPRPPPLPAPLPAAWHARPAEEVARALLGCLLVRQEGRRLQVARVVETEAYVGPHDLACHASRGLTPRTRVMFGPPGRAYVYFIYGMHEMLNVVTAHEGDPQAVLVRAVEPVHGVAGRTDGPGRLTRALGIDRSLNGHPLDAPPLWFAPGPPPQRIGIGPRINVDFALEWAHAPLRFWEQGNPHVSRPARRRP